MTHFFSSCICSPKPQQPPAETLFLVDCSLTTKLQLVSAADWQLHVPLWHWWNQGTGRLHGKISTQRYTVQWPRSPRAMCWPCLGQLSWWICPELQQSSAKAHLGIFRLPAMWQGGWTRTSLRSAQCFMLLMAGLKAAEQLRWALPNLLGSCTRSVGMAVLTLRSSKWRAVKQFNLWGSSISDSCKEHAKPSRLLQNYKS